MEKKLSAKQIDGTVVLPASKSLMHRALMMASLAKGESIIEGAPEIQSQDIQKTIQAMSHFAEISGRETLHVKGNGFCDTTGITVDAGESASTLRFLIPLFSICGAAFVGEGRLPKRPLDEYLNIFQQRGIVYQRGEDYLPLKVSGGMDGGIFHINGKISSQYITGLLLAAPLFAKDTDLYIEGELESVSYVEMTIAMAKRFGIEIEERQPHKHYFVRAGQEYRPAHVHVEKDWSQAAFFINLGLTGGRVDLPGLALPSIQGDSEYLNIIRRMGGQIDIVNGTLSIQKSHLKGTRADVRNIIDVALPLAALMCVSEGESRIVGGNRLRLKESDRISDTVAALQALGADICETEDGFVIHGKPRLNGGTAQSAGDHRIAMALASITPKMEQEMTLQGAEAVKKSYPGFYEDFCAIGGSAK